MLSNAVPNDALVILVGPSGSGKSTYANRNFPSDAIVSAEILCRQMGGEPCDPVFAEQVFDLLQLVAGARLDAGKLTVVDSANVTLAHQKRWAALAQRHHRPIVFLVLDCALAECVERNRARGYELCERLLELQYGSYTSSLGALRQLCHDRAVRTVRTTADNVAAHAPNGRASAVTADRVARKVLAATATHFESQSQKLEDEAGDLFDNHLPGASRARKEESEFAAATAQTLRTMEPPLAAIEAVERALRGDSAPVDVGTEQIGAEAETPAVAA